MMYITNCERLVCVASFLGLVTGAVVELTSARCFYNSVSIIFLCEALLWSFFFIRVLKNEPVTVPHHSLNVLLVLVQSKV